MTRPYRIKVTHVFGVSYLANNYWYWTLYAANGKIVADGAETYKTEQGIKRAINRLLMNEAFGINVIVEWPKS